MAQIVFLRGVNVGGNKTFRPSLLVKQLQGCDAINVGAAGTFVIRNKISEARLRSELNRRLPFQAEIMICSDLELIRIAGGKAFEGLPSGKDIVRFVSVLHKRPKALPTLPLDLPEGRWLVRLLAVDDRFVFGIYRREMQTIRYLGQVEKHLAQPATTRNFNTIAAVVKILNSS